MHIRRVTSLGLLLSFLAMPALANPNERLSPQAVARRLEGLLVHEADDFEIQMSSCEVRWEPAPLSSGEAVVYLYQEQARRDRLDQPYRQRLLKISANTSETVISDSFRFVTPEQWIGLCRDQNRDRTLSPSDLHPAHCRVTLRQAGHAFVGATPEPGCPSQYRGAAFVHNRIILKSDGMETYDQGLDADGNRVWGADGEPYVFRKVISP